MTDLVWVALSSAGAALARYKKEQPMMTDKERNDFLALLNQAVDTITRLQARIDAAESLTICMFAQLPRADQDGVIEAVLDRMETVADARIPMPHLEAHREAAQKLQAVLLAKRRAR